MIRLVRNTRGGNVSMPEPLLHLGDVCLMVKRVGGGRGPQRVRAEALDVHPHTLGGNLRGLSVGELK